MRGDTSGPGHSDREPHHSVPGSWSGMEYRCTFPPKAAWCKSTNPCTSAAGWLVKLGSGGGRGVGRLAGIGLGSMRGERFTWDSGAKMITDLPYQTELESSSLFRLEIEKGAGKPSGKGGERPDGERVWPSPSPWDAESWKIPVWPCRLAKFSLDGPVIKHKFGGGSGKCGGKVSPLPASSCSVHRRQSRH